LEAEFENIMEAGGVEEKYRVSITHCSLFREK